MSMSKKDRSAVLKASLTVEAAMIAPVLMTAVFLLLYLTAHVHNRSCLYALAAEQAVSGRAQEDPSLFAMAELKVQRSDSKKERVISYKAGTLYLDGERMWSIEEKAVYEKCFPVKRLRQIAAAKSLTGLDS